MNPQKKPLGFSYRWIDWVGLYLLSMAGLLIAFWAGRQSVHTSSLNESHESHGLLGTKCFLFVNCMHEITTTNRICLAVSPGTVHQVWKPNLTFSQAPSLESEAAWNSLIPGKAFLPPFLYINTSKY